MRKMYQIKQLNEVKPDLLELDNKIKILKQFSWKSYLETGSESKSLKTNQ